MKITKFIHKNEALIILLSFLVLLRIPSLFEPAWYGDENIYLAIGQGVRKGLTLYKEIIDYPNKPPLIYLLAALTSRVFWFRFLLIAWSGINAVLMFKLAERLFKSRKYIWYITSLAFVLLTSLPFWEGNIANGEIFMIMPVTAGMLLMWTKKYFWAGIMLSLGFLFKIPVAVDIAAAGLFFIVLKRKINFKWFLGLSIPIGLMLVAYLVQGVTPLQLLGNAVGSSGYVSVWEPQEKLIAWLTLGTIPSRLVALTFALGVVISLKRKLSEPVLFGAVWFLFALFGALLSGRPYPHYLLQVVPSLVIFSGAVWMGRINKANIWVGVGVFMLLGAAIVRFGFGSYPVIGYYKNFFQYVSQVKTSDEYINWFDSRMTRNYTVAKYIKAATKQTDKIYVWGTDPGIYFLSDRLQVGRLVTSFHVEDLNEYEKLGQELKLEQPKYIVVMESEPREFIQLDELLDQKYGLVKTIDEAKIYRLMPL